MAEAYIVEVVRTPVGKKNGGLKDVHSADLGAHVLKELIARADVDPAAVDDVIFGCTDALGPQAGDVARAWDEGRFDREVAPIAGVTRDEGVRPDTSLEKMASLPTVKGCERITAAVSSQISDASSAVLVANDRAVREHGLTPRARVHF